MFINQKHYNHIAEKLRELDAELLQPMPANIPVPPMDPQQPTAVILVGRSPGVAMHNLLYVLRIFPRHFKNFIFISAGIVDVSSFTGQAALEHMRQEVNKTLQYFVDYCHQYGFAAQAYASYGTDTVEELSALAETLGAKFPNCIYFASKLIFEHDNWILRLLHNETAVALQRQLHLRGKELVILPMQLTDEN